MVAEMTSRVEPSPNPKRESYFFFIPKYIEDSPSIELNTIVKIANMIASLPHLAKSSCSSLISNAVLGFFFSLSAQHFF
jgi:hypothetical protein